MVIGNFFIVMVVTIIAWCIYRFALYKQNKVSNILREVVLFLFLIYFLLLLSLTVFKGFGIEYYNQFDSYMYKSKGILGIINIIPFKDTIETLIGGQVPIQMPLRNIFGNVLLFVPLGFIIPILFNKYDKLSKILTLGFVSSLSIECVQLFVGYNICDVDDLIFNTTGAVLGLLCYRIFKKLLLKTRLESTLENISDYNTEKLFKKSYKVIIVIALLVVASYIYGFFTQTASNELSDMELAKKLFTRNKDSEFIKSKDLGNKKFYLVKNESGLSTQALSKYGKDRYANTYEGYGYYPSDDVGYSVGLVYNYDDSERGTATIVVFGKNSNASKLVISLLGKDYEFNLKNNDYFLEIYPYYLELDANTITDIYNMNESDNFKVKFLDKNNKEIKEIEAS